MENRPEVMYGSIYIEKIVFPERLAIPQRLQDEHLGSMLNVYKTSKLAEFEPNWDDLIYYIKIYEFDREKNRFQELYGFRL